MTLNAAKEWCLKSGSWVIAEEAPGLELKNSALGAAVSPLLSREDIASLTRARRSAAHPALLFPPEFSYSPITGEKLLDSADTGAGTADLPVWIPPSGIRPLTDADHSGPSGLRSTSLPLTLSEREHRGVDDEGDVGMSLPPPGSYEFFSGRFGTPGAVLLALDPRKGQVCGWLPVSKKWLPLASKEKQLLAESALPRFAWRAEMALGAGAEHRIYLPTQHGMAVLVADMVSLTYRVDYVGDSPAAGAPIWFDNKVWTPLQDAAGTVQFVNADANANNQAAGAVALQAVPPLDVVGSPVVCGRMAIWPCAQGQLQLYRQSNGDAVTARFVPWADGVVPKFEFGSPYCSKDGDLWQLCLDTKRDAYIYVKLGSGETVPQVLAPRLCSGYFNYLFASKLRTEPWREDDVATSADIVIPLLESSATGTVVGFKFQDNRGLEVLMNAKERVRGQLIVDAATETQIYTITIAEPWQFRLFCHEGVLWAYHPALSRIVGWKLSV